MHEFVGVIVEPSVTRETAHEVVEKILAPFEEDYNDGTEELEGWWDYWLIGGRWTGVWLPGYEPDKDPANVDPRPCFICNGTGHRPDIGDIPREKYIEWCGGCNGCNGIGHQVKWPSRYRPIEQDCLPVREFLADSSLRSPRRLVLPDAPGISRDDLGVNMFEERSPEWDELVRTTLKPFADAKLVVVDAHS